MQPAGISYCFGPFELHPARYELLRGVRRIRIPVSLVELLLLFVSRPGELVTREQIVAVLWKEPQSVDVRQGINTAVARLRAALEDDPADPRFLETVIGKGYRFIGAVEKVSPPEHLLPLIAPVSPPGLREVPPGLPAFTTHNAVVFDSTVLATPASHPPRHLLLAGNKVLLAGAIVAILCGAALALGHVVQGATPARGFWDEHQVTTNDVEVPVEAAALSPDGNLMAYMAANGLFLREMKTGRTRELKAPPLRVSRLAWFPNLTGLMITGYATGSGQPEIWIASTTGDPLLFNRAADGGVPSPDGQHVAFISVDGREIHIADVYGRNERTFVKAVADEPFAALFWSFDGKRIGCQQRHLVKIGELDITFRSSYVSWDVQTGAETSSDRNLFFNSAAETADGKLYFLRTGNGAPADDRGIWIMPIDSATGEPLGKTTRICCVNNAHHLSGLSVSANGAQVVAVMELWHPNLSVAEVEPNGPALIRITRLTFDDRSDFPHAGAGIRPSTSNPTG